MATYKVTDKTTGIDYETEQGHRRVESGETAEDIPAESVASLIEQGLIEEVTEPLTEEVKDDESDAEPEAEE